MLTTSRQPMASYQWYSSYVQYVAAFLCSKPCCGLLLVVRHPLFYWEASSFQAANLLPRFPSTLHQVR